MSRLYIDIAPFYLLVSQGKIPGMSIVQKFGRNTDVDSGTLPEDMWGGSSTYTGFPVGGNAERLAFVSTSADDAEAGTGARTVTIIGLDGNWNQQTETVTLNGLTTVYSTGT